MDETHVVTAFLRHGPDVLLTRRSDAVGTYEGRWAGVSGYAEGDPERQVWVEIREETGLERAAVDLVRAGDPLRVEDDDRRWVVHPFLFDASTRDVAPNEELADIEWVPPTEFRSRKTVPGLWDAYDRVRPTIATIRDDRDHGSAWLSLRALDVLRDDAAIAADWTECAAIARNLLDARPDMAALRNRVNHAMTTANDTGRTPEAVVDAAITVAEAAASADSDAAENARSLVEDRRVATHSRSGTVLDALNSGDLAGVVVSEARPGREGIPVAEALAATGLDVTLTTDANLPNAATGCDLVLVGADTVNPDGSVVNKVGTRALALGAQEADISVYAVAAADKIATESTSPSEQAEPDTLYDGTADISLDSPRFDLTPSALFDGLVTEEGVLDTEDIRDHAARHRRLADWADRAHWADRAE